MGTIVTSILQMKTPRLREVASPARGFRAGTRQSESELGFCSGSARDCSQSIPPHHGKPEAQGGSVSFPQTPCKAMGAMGLEPVVIQGPIRTPATALCSPSISNEEIQPPFQLLLLWTPPHPINCKHFVDAAGVNDPGLTREIFLWNLPKLWRAPDPGERGTRSVAGNQCLAWPKRTRGPAPLPSAPAVVAGLLP